MANDLDFNSDQLVACDVSNFCDNFELSMLFILKLEEQDVRKERVRYVI